MKQTLKVLHVFSGMRTPQADRAFLFPHLAVLRELGCQVALMAPAGRSYTELARKLGFQVFAWPTHGKLDLLNMVRLGRLFRAWRPDIVDTHFSTASLHSALIGRLLKVPVVSTVHATNTATCFRYSLALIAVSEGVRQHMISQGIPPDRVFTVRNGIDTDWFTLKPADYTPTLREQLGLSAQSRLICAIGRLTERKGHRVLVEALAQLVQSGLDVHVAIAGAGPLAEALAKQAADLRVADRLHLLGLIEDVRPLLWESDVYAMPSLGGEGLSKALLQAMACGAPVVATDIAGVQEAVTDSETGLLVSPSDASVLAAALQRLLNDAPLATRLATSARTSVEKDFSSRRVAQELLQVYTKVLENWGKRQ